MKFKTTTTLLIILVTIGMFLGFTVLGDKDPNASRTTESVQITSITPLQTDGLSAFPESFEGTTFPPTGWIKLSPDGGTGWERDTVGTTPVPGWTGGVITSPPGGENAVAFCTWSTGGATANDQWLVTPQLSGITASDSLIYWIKRTFDDYADTVEIRVSTTTPDTAAFTNLMAKHIFAESNGDTLWKRQALGIGMFAGQNIYIAWREIVTDNLTYGAAISLDLVSFTGNIIGIKNNEMPVKYELSQNYPNPFNPSTTINYSIKQSGLVTLKVYDVLGKEVETLVNEVKSSGSYNVNFDGTNLSNGVYFYKIEVGDFAAIKKMILLK